MYGVKKKNSIILHLAKRSRKLKKFPGLYDNLIAGGQPTNISILDNLHKEGYEESGLKKKYTNLAKKSNVVHYKHNDKKNFNSAIIFIYQLEKLDEMHFSNTDGEVEGFLDVEIDELYKILENKELKANCIIPILDFFILKKNDFISKKVMLEIQKLFRGDV